MPGCCKYLYRLIYWIGIIDFIFIALLLDARVAMGERERTEKRSMNNEASEKGKIEKFLHSIISYLNSNEKSERCTHKKGSLYQTDNSTFASGVCLCVSVRFPLLVQKRFSPDQFPILVMGCRACQITFFPFWREKTHTHTIELGLLGKIWMEKEKKNRRRKKLAHHRFRENSIRMFCRRILHSIRWCFDEKNNQ